MGKKVIHCHHGCLFCKKWVKKNWLKINMELGIKERHINWIIYMKTNARHMKEQEYWQWLYGISCNMYSYIFQSIQ